MDLKIVMGILFPKEDVCADLSSYSSMVATWRGSKPPPTEQECLDIWDAFDKANYLVKRNEEYIKQGITDHEKVTALWESFVNSKSIQADELKVKIDAIDAAIPEPVKP